MGDKYTTVATLSAAMRGKIRKRIKNEAIKCHYSAFKSQFSFAELAIDFALSTVYYQFLAASLALLSCKLIAYSITFCNTL